MSDEQKRREDIDEIGAMLLTSLRQSIMLAWERGYHAAIRDMKAKLDRQIALETCTSRLTIRYRDPAINPTVRECVRAKGHDCPHKAIDGSEWNDAAADKPPSVRGTSREQDEGTKGRAT